MSNMILAYAALIISFGVLYLIVYMKRNSNIKRLEFTQRIIEQHKDVTVLVSKIITNQSRDPFSDLGLFSKEEEEENTSDTYTLLIFFSTLANGIDRGVYDENLIRINYEQNIKLFYRYSGPYMRNLRISSDFDEMFLPVEFLIKEWENKKTKKKKVSFFG